MRRHSFELAQPLPRALKTETWQHVASVKAAQKGLGNPLCLDCFKVLMPSCCLERINLGDGVNSACSSRRDEGAPRWRVGGRIHKLQQLQIVLGEVAVLLHCRTHRGHLAKVGHQSRPVTSAKGSRVHRLATSVGRKGKVGGDPGDRGDEASHAGSAARRGAVWAFQTIIVDRLVQEHHSLTQVGGSLATNPPICRQPARSRSRTAMIRVRSADTAHIPACTTSMTHSVRIQGSSSGCDS